jgi:hypothetical protein
MALTIPAGNADPTPTTIACSVFASALNGAPTVTIDVPSGAMYVARCQHGAEDPTERLPTVAAVEIKFRCSPNSTLVLDGWRQHNGSLEILPPVGSAALEGVRVETRRSVFVEATAGHALSFVASVISACVLRLGAGTVLRGAHVPAGSFVNSDASVAKSTVTDSAIIVAENCAIHGARAAAAVVWSSGIGTIDLINVTLVAMRGAVVQATVWGPPHHIAALGIAAHNITARDLTVSADGCTIDAVGESTVSVGLLVHHFFSNSALVLDNVTLLATQSNISARGTEAAASVGIAAYAALGSNITANRLSLTAKSSNVTSFTGKASASVGVAIFSYRSGICGIGNSNIFIESSTLAAHGSSASAASAGVSVRSGESSNISTANVTIAATRSTADAFGGSAVSTMGLAAQGGASGMRSAIVAEDMSIFAVASVISATGLESVACLGIAGPAVESSNVTLSRARLSASFSTVAASGTRVVSSLGVANSGSITSAVNANETIFTVTASNVTSTGTGYAVAAVGFATFSTGGAALYTTRARANVTSSNVSSSGGNAVASVGFAAMCDIYIPRTVNVTADDASMTADDSTITAQGQNAVASLGIATSHTDGTLREHQRTTIAARRARFLASSSHVTSIAASVTGPATAASVGVASSTVNSMLDTAVTSSINIDDSSFRATEASVVNSTGAKAVASVALAVYSNGVANVVVDISAARLALVSSRSFIDAYASDSAAASVGIATLTSSRNRDASCSLAARSAAVSASMSNVTARGKLNAVSSLAVTATMIEWVTKPSNVTLSLENATVTVCTSGVVSFGQNGVSAVGAASSGTLTLSSTHVSVTNSFVSAGVIPTAQWSCSVATPCGELAMVSFVAPRFSASAAPSCTLLLLDSRVEQSATQFAPVCVHVGNAPSYSGVLIANSTFKCSGLGWKTVSTPIAPGIAVVLLPDSDVATVSSFPNASNDPSAVAGSLGTPAQASADANAVCNSLGLENYHPQLPPTQTRTRSSTRSGLSMSASVVARTPSRAVWTSSRTTTSSLRPVQADPIASISITRPTTYPHAATTTPSFGGIGERTAKSETPTIEAFASSDHEGDIRSLAPTSRTTLLPTAVTAGATGTALVASAVAGLVGLPVASRPAIVGATIRLSQCEAGADGPEVPPYQAMPVQFTTLDSPVSTAGLVTATNAAFVGLCMAAGYAAAKQTPAATEQQHHADTDTSVRASLAHLAAIVPLSFIGPALMEFSVSWLTAGVLVKAFSVCFAAGLTVALGGLLLLLWWANGIGTSPAAFDSGGRLRPRYAQLVAPLLAGTRDAASRVVRWAFFVELGAGFAFSGVSGLRIASLCIAKCVVATVIAAGFLGYLLVVKPAQDSRDHWFGVAFALLQTATGAVITCAVLVGGPWAATALDATEIIGLVTLGLIAVQAVVELVASAHERSKQQPSSAPDPSFGMPLLAVPPSTLGDSSAGPVPQAEAGPSPSGGRGDQRAVESSPPMSRVSNPLQQIPAAAGRKTT